MALDYFFKKTRKELKKIMSKRITSTKKLREEAEKRTMKKKPITRIALLQMLKIFIVVFADTVIATTIFTYIIPVVTSYLCGAGNVTLDSDLRFVVNAWIMPSLGFTIAIAIVTVKALHALDKKICKGFNNVINKLKENYGITEDDEL